jgi:predicted nucleotidyltransferase
MERKYKKYNFYLFGSYLSNTRTNNDIDCLMVIDSEDDLNYALEWTNNFKNKKMHFTIYTKEEFNDKQNKFSINGIKKLEKINEPILKIV